MKRSKKRKVPIRDRLIKRINHRRSRGDTPEQVAAYARSAMLTFRVDLTDILFLPEKVAIERYESELSREREERHAAWLAGYATGWCATAGGRGPAVTRDRLGVGAVCEGLGCTRAEVNRWASDGRLPPDGKRFFSHPNMGKTGQWGRAWLPETVAAARSLVAEWRKQDETKRKYARRGLRSVP